MLIDSERLTLKEWFDINVGLKFFSKELEEIIESSEEKDEYICSLERQKKSIEKFLEIAKEVFDEGYI